MLNINLNQLEKVVMDFYYSTKIMLVIFDEKGNLMFCIPNKHNPFCAEVRKSSQLAQNCENCAERAFQICSQTKKTYIHHCHMGLTEAASPIFENEEIIGYIWLGPLLGSKSNIERLTANIVKIGKKHKIDPDVLIRELRHMQIVDEQRIISTVNMMEMCVYYLHTKQIISGKADNMINLISNYIHNHLAKDLSAKSICQHVHISRSRLYKLSAEYFNMGISSYVRLKRLERAKQFLDKGNLSITEIAEAVGISDANYFTKLWKKQTGKTPREYKRSIKQANPNLKNKS